MLRYTSEIIFIFKSLSQFFPIGKRKIEERKLITANDIPKTAVDCEIKDLEMGLYIGQLAGKLRIITDKGYPVGNINMQNNEQLLLQLEKYSKQMGYPGNLRLNNTRIGYTKEVVGKMLESDFLKNQNFGYKNYKGIILKWVIFNIF